MRAVADIESDYFKRLLMRWMSLMGFSLCGILFVTESLDPEPWTALQFTLLVSALIYGVSRIWLSNYRYLHWGSSLVCLTSALLLSMALLFNPQANLSGAHHYISSMIIMTWFLAGLPSAIFMLVYFFGLEGVLLWLEGAEVSNDVLIETSSLIDRFLAPSVTLLVISIADRSRRFASERANRQQEELRVKRTLSGIGLFVGGIGHEIKNPLAIIRGATGLLQRQLIKDSETYLSHEHVGRWISTVDLNAKRIEQVVESLLHLAQQRQRGQNEMRDQNRLSSELTIDQKTQIGIEDSLREVLQILGPKIEAFGVKIYWQWPRPGSRTLVNGHLYHLVSLLRIMIDNAVDALAAMPAGPPRNLGFRQRFLKQQCVLDIEDNGPGIPNELQARIKDPFFSTKNVGEGTGIGLALAYGIAEALGWQIKLESQPGRTVFSVIFPRFTVEAGESIGVSAEFRQPSESEASNPENVGMVSDKPPGLERLPSENSIYKC